MSYQNQQIGYNQIKTDLKEKSYKNLYVFFGDEDYLKKLYINKMKNAIVNKSFKEFNLIELEAKNITTDIFINSIESCPMFCDKKLVIIKDFNLYKPPLEFKEILPQILCDLPEYTCLVFYYETIKYAPDKKMKIYKIINTQASINEFCAMSEGEIIPILKKHTNKYGKQIDTETCRYLLFLCGNSMTNLFTEIDKAISYTNFEQVRKSDIENVCIKTLDAVVFDIADNISKMNFESAILILRELIAQKNSEVTLFSTVQKHIQKIYCTKLFMLTPNAQKEDFMKLINTNSSFYANKLKSISNNISIEWLRNSIKICCETDSALKSTSTNKQKIIELAFLKMATIENR